MQYYLSVDSKRDNLLPLPSLGPPGHWTCVTNFGQFPSLWENRPFAGQGHVTKSDHKISRLNNSGLKIGNLTNLVMFMPFLATILYHHLFL